MNENKTMHKEDNISLKYVFDTANTQRRSVLWGHFSSFYFSVSSQVNDSLLMQIPGFVSLLENSLLELNFNACASLIEDLSDTHAF